MRTLRRIGFAATLVTGLFLTAFAVNGVSGMDTTLELAARTPDRPVLVSYHDDYGWDGFGDRDRRLT